MHARLAALAARLESYTGKYDQMSWEHCAASVYANEMTDEVNHRAPFRLGSWNDIPRTKRVLEVFGLFPTEGAAEHFGISLTDAVSIFGAGSPHRTAKETAHLIRQVAEKYEENVELPLAA